MDQRWRALVILFLLVWSGFASAEAKPTVENFRLLDHNGNSFELYNYRHKKAIVLIVQGNGCPIIRKYYRTVSELKKRFEPDRVLFLYLNASPQDATRESLRSEAQNFSIDIPILKDEAQVIARALKIRRTGEALVIVPGSWTLAYHGAIDDRIDYTSEKSQTANHALRDAISAVLAGKTVTGPAIVGKGCSISYNDTPVTFKEVAHILKNKCVTCHAPGRVAPTNMQTINEIRGWSSMIREVLRVQRMPPWPADPLYGHFQNDPSLTAEERRKIVHWIETGMPFNPTSDPQKIDVPPQANVRFAPPDRTLKLPQSDTIPATGLIPWRYYQFGEKTNEDLYLTSLRIHDANATNAVHHFSLLVVDKPLAHFKDGKMWEAANQNIVVLGGQGERFDFPRGVGFLIPKGHYLIVQAHFEATGKPEDIRLQIQMWTKRKGQSLLPAHFGYLTNEDMNIPAGKTYTFTMKQKIERDIHLLQLNYHMHLRGRSTRMLVHYPNGKSETLFSIPAFNQYREITFSLVKPKLIPKGSVIEGIGEYDNTHDNPFNPDPSKDVQAGDDLEENEMFKQSFLYY